MIRRGFAVAITLLAGMLLAACGGGDGGGDSATVSEPLALTTGNSEQVAGEVVDTTSTARDFGESGSDFVVAGVVESGDMTFNVVDFSRVQLERFFQVQTVPDPGMVTGVVVQPETFPCGSDPSDGTFTISGNFSDPGSDDALSAGDHLSIDFDHCGGQDGFELDGSIDVVVRSFTGSFVSGAFSIELEYSINNMTATAGTQSIFLDGGYTFAMDTTTAPLLSVSISSGALSLSASNHRVALVDFQIDFTTNTETADYTLSYGGTLDSTALQGSVTFQTLEAFNGNGDNHPSSGKLKVSGANQSSITLTALNSVDVLLEVDADGDGIVDGDGTIMTTWSAIDH
jgi:hypothetical protein